jgi:6-phosphogluconolactonase (cycloisomerase 2 family)
MHTSRLAAAVAATAVAGTSLVTAAVASAQPGRAGHPAREAHAVFVQTNDESGNAILVYRRGAHGTLSRVGRVPTGGLGGSEPGAVVDPLASQGSLTYDGRHHLLYAVNAGSDTLTVFGVHGTRLGRRQVLPTGGHLPVSVGVARGVVYVLNAGGDGSVSGYRVHGRHLTRIPGSTRTLALGNPAAPPFLSSPSQVAVTPDARNVVVATKTHGTLVVFHLGRHGWPSTHPVATSAPDGSVPFALGFDRGAHLLVAGAAGGAFSYAVGGDGTLTPLSGFVANGQAATCWTALARGFLYAANAGSATISSYADHDGVLSLLSPDGVAAATDPGPVDLAATPDGRFLYQLATGAGAVDEYHVGAAGSLTRIGAVTGLGVDDGHGAEGIAAS